jgi:nucleotidyltransferase/DNA polymerase involved in DNA repair
MKKRFDAKDQNATGIASEGGLTEFQLRETKRQFGKQLQSAVRTDSRAVGDDKSEREREREREREEKRREEKRKEENESVRVLLEEIKPQAAQR